MTESIEFLERPLWPQSPLAEAMRPTSLNEVLGQEHLLGQGKSLQVAFASRKIHSMILWGPPGVG